MIGFLEIVGAGGFLNSSKAGHHFHLPTTWAMTYLLRLLGGTAGEWYMGEVLWLVLISIDKIYFNVSLRAKFIRCPPL